MQVVSLAPVPVASLKWRMGEGAWTLTVVCKLTLQLEPGEAEIAKRHDPIYDEDKFPDDDEAASLYAPCDLVPGRKLVDVMVVGNAYAPRGASVTSLRARLKVLSIDKSLDIEAQGDAPFRSAPLGYEYAEAGPTNPVGIADGQGPHAHRIAQRPDPGLTHPGFTTPGFGPIAGHWPTRTSLLRGQPEPELTEPGEPYALPGEFDLGFFNAAPPDQQVPELAPNAELVLDHLHPDHASLRTRLPNVAPQFFLERLGERVRREEVECAISSLWIDTRRSLATVTWHGRVVLRDADERGRVWVAVAGPGRRLTGTQLAKLIGSLSRSQNGTPLSIEDEATSDDSNDPLNRTVALRKASAQLRDRTREDTLTSVLSTGPLPQPTPFTSAPPLPGLPGDTPHPGSGLAPAAAPPAPAPDRSEATGDNLLAQRDDGIPDWVSRQQPPPRSIPQRRSGAPTPSTPPPAPASTAGAPPAPQAPPTLQASATPDVPNGPAPHTPHSPTGIAGPPPRPQQQPQPQTQSQPPPPPPSYAHAPHAAGHAQGPRAPASTFMGLGGPAPSRPTWPASQRMPGPGRDDELADTSSLPKLEPDAQAGRVSPRRVPDEVVELLWFDEQATPRLRRRWRRLCDELDFVPPDERHDLVTPDAKKARDHHVHFGVLTESVPDSVEGLRRCLREAISEQGRFTPPLVLLAGSLRFPFDDLEFLRGIHAVIKPLTGDDKKLKATLTQAEELLATPILSNSTETVQNFTRHLRKRYESAKRPLTLEYLTETVERLLLEQRRYQKRTLFGAAQIRALLTLRGSDKPIPMYLPETLAGQLPMLAAMHARVIAEAHVKQDQFEQHPHALRAVTLGRVIRVEA